MPNMTADMLYEKLLEIKRKDSNHNFNNIDLINLNNPDAQFKQLVNDGRVILSTDIIGSFEVIG